MSLDIPDEARKAGWDALERAFARKLDLPQVYASALEAALPLVVAAELDRLADSAESNANLFSITVIGAAQREAHLWLASRLRARARELRGGTHD